MNDACKEGSLKHQTVVLMRQDREVTHSELEGRLFTVGQAVFYLLAQDRLLIARPDPVVRVVDSEERHQAH